MGLVKTHDIIHLLPNENENKKKKKECQSNMNINF